MRERVIGGSSLSAWGWSQPSITTIYYCWSASSAVKEVIFIQTVQISTRPQRKFAGFSSFFFFFKANSLPNDLLINPRGCCIHANHDMCVWELVCVCVWVCTSCYHVCELAGPRLRQAVGLRPSVLDGRREQPWKHDKHPKGKQRKSQFHLHNGTKIKREKKCLVLQ